MTAFGKLDLLVKLRELKAAEKTIYGISAPSRASTLVNYVGIDDAIIDYVLEVEGSYKIGNYVPGTRIPIVNEQILFERPPDYAILGVVTKGLKTVERIGRLGNRVTEKPTRRVVVLRMTLV